jgi:hypothetical protein
MQTDLMSVLMPSSMASYQLAETKFLKKDVTFIINS